uniref:Uncharacterized protein n=1 Tax=Heliothis virescens TaxID=7102 RepID=A0A2A4JAK2_HELVI
MMVCTGKRVAHNAAALRKKKSFERGVRAAGTKVALRAARGAGARRAGARRVRGPAGARAADAAAMVGPRQPLESAARPGRRGMSSAPARPGRAPRHGAGRARAPSHPLLREERPSTSRRMHPLLLGSAVGLIGQGYGCEGTRRAMRPARVDTGSGAPRAAGTTSALCTRSPRPAPRPPRARAPAPRAARSRDLVPAARTPRYNRFPLLSLETFLNL